MYQQEMIDFVSTHPNILSLWIDANGDWHTSARPNAKEVLRADILGKTKAKKAVTKPTETTDETDVTK